MRISQLGLKDPRSDVMAGLGDKAWPCAGEEAHIPALSMARCNNLSGLSPHLQNGGDFSRWLGGSRVKKVPDTEYFM